MTVDKWFICILVCSVGFYAGLAVLAVSVFIGADTDFGIYTIAGSIFAAQASTLAWAIHLLIDAKEKR